MPKRRDASGPLGALHQGNHNNYKKKMPRVRRRPQPTGLKASMTALAAARCMLVNNCIIKCCGLSRGRTASNGLLACGSTMKG
jgi:hypothetical protein